MSRVIVYLDGFNLYHGIKAGEWNDCLWLDLGRLARRLVKPHQTLVGVKYFTAMIRYPHDKRKRQRILIEALMTIGGIDIFFGRYQKNIIQCRNCSSRWRHDNEKMTDVRIAVEMLADAFEDRFDTALLVSADGDLQPPVTKIKELFPDKRIVVFFPPHRYSPDLEREADACLTLWRGILAACQLPERVTKPDGYVLRRPPSWA